MRSGSCSPNMPANGPSVPGGSARVPSRAWRISFPSCSSTRSESHILGTCQSIPAPINDAISFAVSTTESGPALVRRLPTFFCPEAVADGVGAPTAVSATGGSAVDRPNQCATVAMIGARNHHASASAPTKATAQPSLKTPLRQPLMVFDLIHRTILVECALHQVHLGDRHRFIEFRAGENLLESLEVAWLGGARRASQSHVRPERPRFSREAEGCEHLLDAMLQQFESRILCHSGPQH